MSTYTRGEFGGVAGRALRRGDVLPVAEANDRSEIELPSPPQDGDSPIRVIPGPQDDYFTDRAFAALYEQPFTVSSAADRIGLRLDGPSLEHSRPADIPSDGTVHGMIQVPPSGQAIILLNDRQTTGGYPKIATVITADLPRVGRLIPTRQLRFAPVTPAEGVQLARERARDFERILATARPVGRQAHLTTDLLLSTNLVGGVVTAMEDLP
jgi:allophanate hydrolase subunit 2